MKKNFQPVPLDIWETMTFLGKAEYLITDWAPGNVRKKWKKWLLFVAIVLFAFMFGHFSA